MRIDAVKPELEEAIRAGAEGRAPRRDATSRRRRLAPQSLTSTRPPSSTGQLVRVVDSNNFFSSVVGEVMGRFFSGLFSYVLGELVSILFNCTDRRLLDYRDNTVE